MEAAVIPRTIDLRDCECELRVRYSNGDTTHCCILVQQIRTSYLASSCQTEIEIRGLAGELVRVASSSTAARREDPVLQNQPPGRRIRLDPNRLERVEIDEYETLG